MIMMIVMIQTWIFGILIMASRDCHETSCGMALTVSPWIYLPFFSICFFVFGTAAPQWARASSFTRFLDHTQRRTTVGRTPLDERSASRRDLYLHNTHTTHNWQTSMLPVGFEPTISAGERPQSYSLDRTATGTGCFSNYFHKSSYKSVKYGIK